MILRSQQLAYIIMFDGFLIKEDLALFKCLSLNGIQCKLGLLSGIEKMFSSDTNRGS